MDFKLFGKTILVVNKKKFGAFFWPINLGSENLKGIYHWKSLLFQADKNGLAKVGLASGLRVSVPRTWASKWVAPETCFFSHFFFWLMVGRVSPHPRDIPRELQKIQKELEESPPGLKFLRTSRHVAPSELSQVVHRTKELFLRELCVFGRCGPCPVGFPGLRGKCTMEHGHGYTADAMC